MKQISRTSVQDQLLSSLLESTALRFGLLTFASSISISSSRSGTVGGWSMYRTGTVAIQIELGSFIIGPRNGKDDAQPDEPAALTYARKRSRSG
jgi:hypothetical protein